jgi:DNA helicase-2/ATP-dependent DNA helicase PcrA
MCVALWLAPSMACAVLAGHYKLAKCRPPSRFLTRRPALQHQTLVEGFNVVDERRFPLKQLMYFIAGCKEDVARQGWLRTVAKYVKDGMYEGNYSEGVVDFGS